MTTELKPCPLCGKNCASLRTERAGEIGFSETLYFVECDCGISTGFGDSCGGYWAVDAWNSLPRAQDVSAIAEMRDALLGAQVVIAHGIQDGNLEGCDAVLAEIDAVLSKTKDGAP